MRLQLKKEWVIPTIAGVASFVGGAVSGYLFSQYRFRKAVEELEEETTQIAELGFMLEESGRLINHTLQQLNHMLQAAQERMMNSAIDDTNERHPAGNPDVPYLMQVLPLEETQEEPVVRSLFPDEDDDWNYAEELGKRNPNKPYIIHKEEYLAEEAAGYTQQTITYYAGDNILCDEHDVPVYNPGDIVGDLRFGHGTGGDPNVLYVRNESLMSEFEILLDHGHYQVEVLGAELEEEMSKGDMKHSVLKFRDE